MSTTLGDRRDVDNCVNPTIAMRNRKAMLREARDAAEARKTIARLRAANESLRSDVSYLVDAEYYAKQETEQCRAQAQALSGQVSALTNKCGTDSAGEERCAQLQAEHDRLKEEVKELKKKTKRKSFLVLLNPLPLIRWIFKNTSQGKEAADKI